MDPNTASAMYNLFEITKPGCCEAAHELMRVSHSYGQKASSKTVSIFGGHGLVLKDGTIPGRIKRAICKAVACSYLSMDNHVDCALEPEPHVLGIS